MKPLVLIIALATMAVAQTTSRGIIFSDSSSMRTKYYSPKIYDKYYITIPFDYKAGDSIVVYVKKDGLGRIDAMCSFGATVWTENEWKNMQSLRKQIDSIQRQTKTVNHRRIQ